MNYEFSAIEAKWHKYWEENDTFHTDVWDFSKPKYYVLDMFPYPSGVGLHAGHPEGYTATDIMSRMKRMQGYNVLHPMGYDSFGLPAEQYAVSTGNHPNGFTQKNIETFSKQLKELGFDYDWSKLTATSDPEFYKWTQWIFKKLWEAGYAKRIEMPVNWCEELGTVLANDEVIDGKSERGGYPVVKKMMMQWVIDQPAFAEKLLEGLEEIDWPEATKEIQRNWIGKSTGALVDFGVLTGGACADEKITVYTTRCDTLFGVTYMVISPEHPFLEQWKDQIKNWDEVQAYRDEAARKSDFERGELNKDTTGVRLDGIEVINPATGNIEAVTIEEQTEQVCKNIGAILEANGIGFDKVVKTTCFLADMGDFVTIALVMTVGILGGVVCCIFFLKKYMNKLQGKGKKEKQVEEAKQVKQAEQDDFIEDFIDDISDDFSADEKDRSFGTYATTAMFVGLCAAYIGSYVGKAMPSGGADLMPLFVAGVAALCMAVFEFLIQKKN